MGGVAMLSDGNGHIKIKEMMLMSGSVQILDFAFFSKLQTLLEIDRDLMIMYARCDMVFVYVTRSMDTVQIPKRHMAT
jgi:hypothetical protein